MLTLAFYACIGAGCAFVLYALLVDVPMLARLWLEQRRLKREEDRLWRVLRGAASGSTAPHVFRVSGGRE